MKHTKTPTHIADILWDAWCVASVVGIWPRFIEPHLIRTTKVRLQINKLPPQLNGLKIVQFSDLHLSSNVPECYTEKLLRKIDAAKPDIVLFTGDFICYSHLDDRERLRSFLNKIHAPYGCYAVFGNHDYAQSVAINPKGEYDVMDDKHSMISKGVNRLFSSITLAKKTTERALAIPHHNELISVLAETHFQLLDNRTQVVSIKGEKLNLCGLGEFTLGRCDPEQAFKDYDEQYPGVILAHNPDSIPMLRNYPGEVILCGHTHGGQVNLPWMWKKFTLLENMQYKAGLKKVDGKWAYINRGIGGVMKFRWFATPEILQLTLETSDGK